VGDLDSFFSVCDSTLPVDDVSVVKGLEGEKIVGVEGLEEGSVSESAKSADVECTIGDGVVVVFVTISTGREGGSI